MAAESYIENTQERYEKALAAEAIRIEKLKAEQRIVDGLKQTAWALVDVAAIGLAIMSGGTLAPISVAILTFSAAEITEGAGNIYLGITGDGSSIAFNPIRDTLFMGNQDVYNVASLAVNIADMKLSKPKVSSLDDIARFGAKSVEAKGINRVKDLTKKLLGKVDDVGDVKKGGKGNFTVEDIIKRIEDGEISLADNLQKGNYGEMKMDVFFEGKGYKRISLDKVTDLNAPSHQGIDGVYYNPNGHPPYIIGEAKYGSSRLSTLADGTPQMSNKWIIDRLENAVGETFANEIKIEMILNPDNVESTLVHVSKNGGIDITKLIDGVK